VTYPEVLNRLIEQLKKLPGIGSRSAERLALAISAYRAQEAVELADAVRDVARSLHCCSVCFNTSERNPCAICSDQGRERDKILVVEGPAELNAFESAGWRGLYHVLQGRLDPLEGVLPEHLTLEVLRKRVAEEKISEVVIGTSPDYEGDGTALIVMRELKGSGVKVSRIARGVPAGSSIEYSSGTILSDALEGRTSLS
jgi:recombination protein RecR